MEHYFSYFIKQLASIKGLNQSQLAKKIDMTRQSIFALGKRKPTAKALMKFKPLITNSKEQVIWKELISTWKKDIKQKAVQKTDIDL